MPVWREVDGCVLGPCPICTSRGNCRSTCTSATRNQYGPPSLKLLNSVGRPLWNKTYAIGGFNRKKADPLKIYECYYDHWGETCTAKYRRIQVARTQSAYDCKICEGAGVGKEDGAKCEPCRGTGHPIVMRDVGDDQWYKAQIVTVNRDRTAYVIEFTDPSRPKRFGNFRPYNTTLPGEVHKVQDGNKYRISRSELRLKPH